MRILLGIILFLFSCIQYIQSQTTMNIWKGIKSNSVTLKAYIPKEGKPSVAIIVCAGGSYFWNGNKAEGTKVAEWLMNNGIAAFLLDYRTPGTIGFLTHYRAIVPCLQYPDVIQDVQRAIQVIRNKASELGGNDMKLGVMGFSAGGHLAMLAAELYKTDYTGQLNVLSPKLLRPDFVAPIYPVVTLSDSRYVHKRSRRGLLGEWRQFNHRMQDSLSLEKHVPDDCPPVFLCNCINDPIVKYQNSVLLDSALTAHHIPHKYIQYRTGGHGFGADTYLGTDESRQWMSEFIKWLKDINIRK